MTVLFCYLYGNDKPHIFAKFTGNLILGQHKFSKMKRIFITGATGNIGFEVIHYLFKQHSKIQIIAGVRHIHKAKQLFPNFPQLEFRRFDFEDPATFEQALIEVDCVFLLRPPHISDVEKYIKPLVSILKEKGISQIVFLSVQGAEKSKVIPHNKIENLILANGFNYIFLRPSYFMQNLTTTLIDDVRKRRNIILPAGKAKFNWIDVKNIGEAAAILLENFEKYQNEAIELTGLENKNFYEVSVLIKETINENIGFKNIDPISFFYIKKREGISSGMILVMIMLHFLPRFQKEPQISTFYEELTGKKPTALKTFIEREKKNFL
jgi:uncharacterized protein YbjT (DUF2867 family)